MTNKVKMTNVDLENNQLTNKVKMTHVDLQNNKLTNRVKMTNVDLENLPPGVLFPFLLSFPFS